MHTHPDMTCTIQRALVVGFLDGAILHQGVMSTRVAAQVAFQHAFKTRLHRSGLNHWIADEYQWKQLVI